MRGILGLALRIEQLLLGLDLAFEVLQLAVALGLPALDLVFDAGDDALVSVVLGIGRQLLAGLQGILGVLDGPQPLLLQILLDLLLVLERPVDPLPGIELRADLEGLSRKLFCTSSFLSFSRSSW